MWVFAISKNRQPINFCRKRAFFYHLNMYFTGYAATTGNWFFKVKFLTDFCKKKLKSRLKNFLLNMSK
jgi:hypothetical protein